MEHMARPEPAPRAPRPGRRARRLLAVTAIAVLLSGCTVRDITAAPAAGGYDVFLPEVTSADAGLREDFEKTPQETHDFWSDPNKLKDADGMQFQTPDNNLPTGSGDPATGAYLAATAPMPATPQGYGDVSQAKVYDRSGLGASTFGRLYVTFDGTNVNVCSATVVNSSTQSVVITAAHCAMTTDGTKKIAQSALFVPGDRGDMAETPFGRWAAVSVYVPQQFADNARTDANGMLTSTGGWNYDFAFLTMEKQNGSTLQQATGGQGIAFGVPVDTLTQIGYPTGPPYDGSDEYLCASTSYSSNWQGGYTHPCTMTQGASGGGWLSGMDRPSGTGYVVGVTSTIDPNGNTNAPVLGQTALSLYQQADGGR